MELADQFGVNRSTVREGIRQIESEGLVRREGRKRLLVSVPRYADLTPRLTRAMVMQEVTFRELWQVANELEPLAAGLTAMVAPEEHVGRLQKNIDRMANMIEGAESPAPLDLEFHALLAEGAGNRVLLLAREPVALLLYPTFEAVRPQIGQAARRNLEAHRRIVEAVRRPRRRPGDGLDAQAPARPAAWLAARRPRHGVAHRSRSDLLRRRGETMAWNAADFPKLRHEALFGDRVVPCFSDRPRHLYQLLVDAGRARP